MRVVVWTWFHPKRMNVHFWFVENSEPFFCFFLTGGRRRAFSEVVAEENTNLHALEPAEVSWIHRIKGTGQAICRHRGWNLHFVGDRTVGFLGEGSFEDVGLADRKIRQTGKPLWNFFGPKNWIELGFVDTKID